MCWWIGTKDCLFPWALWVGISVSLGPLWLMHMLKFEELYSKPWKPTMVSPYQETFIRRQISRQLARRLDVWTKKLIENLSSCVLVCCWFIHLAINQGHPERRNVNWQNGFIRLSGDKFMGACSWLLIYVAEPSPLWVVPLLGQVVLGCVREQEKAIFFHGLWFRSCLQVATSIFYPDFPQ